MSEHRYLRRRNEEIKRLGITEGWKIEAIVAWVRRRYPKNKIKRGMVSRILQRFTVSNSRF